jgi:hypothetical protein
MGSFLGVIGLQSAQNAVFSGITAFFVSFADKKNQFISQC